MRDVTAVVLTMGEAYTERALASVARQSAAVAETIVVEGVSPFHRALNAGAARVRSEYFLQVDADMILDPTCSADLRTVAAEATGIVVGQVRDSLRGRVPAIKLFRTRCFEHGGLADTVNQDTDFAARLEREGWRRVYALKRRGDPAGWHTFAAHEPEYTPLYTFCKFVTEGVRSRVRWREARFLNLFRQLRASTHPVVPFAIAGIVHGLFVRGEGDRLVPAAPTPEFEFLARFLAAAGDGGEIAPHSGHPDPRATYRQWHEVGARYRAHGAAVAFLAALHRLRQGEDLGSSVALVGLCRGLLRGDAELCEDLDDLEALLGFTGSMPHPGRASTGSEDSCRRR